MGARLGFADVLVSKLVDVPPPLVPDRPAPRIASPSWVHRLEPLRAVSASFFHARYPQLASAAPAAGGIPVENAPGPARGGSQASSGVGRNRRHSLPGRPAKRTQRQQIAIHLLNRLGATLTLAASDEEVRSAYRRLLRQSHPDMHPDATSRERDAHARKVRSIVRAWDVFQGRSSDLRP
jgi:hypothetical protein